MADDATRPGAGASLGTVVVTGAGGLLGTATAGRLAPEAATVRLLVGPPGTTDPSLPPSAERRWGWMDDPEAVGALVADADVVVHLAGPPSVAGSYRDPVGYARSHVVGTATLLAALADRPGSRLVHVSSAEVYRRPATNPVAEDHPTGPVSPYGTVKLAAETLARSLAGPAGLDLVVLRPFSVYGPRSPAGSLIGRILTQAATAAQIELADLRPVRDYVHVDDVAAAVLAACRAPTAPGPRTFNLASGTGWSVREVAETAARVAGRPLPVRESAALVDRPVGTDVDELIADVSAARTGLGWSPALSLADGLAAALRARGDRG